MPNTAPRRVVAELHRAGIGGLLVLDRLGEVPNMGDRDRLHTGAEVTALEFDDETDHWLVRTGDGRCYRPGVVVATLGPDVGAIDVTGTNGGTLRAAWCDGVASFLGVAVHGFPNLFLTGLDCGGTALGTQAGYIGRAIALMRHTRHTRIEVRAATQHEFLRRMSMNSGAAQRDRSALRRRNPARPAYIRRALRHPEPRHFDLTVPADREPAHDYSGPAVLDAPGAELAVTVTLNGHPDPIDGRYHWYGRVTAQDPAELPDPGRGRVLLTLPGGPPTAATLAERDPWGDLRITGVGEPPFRLATAWAH